MKNTVKHVDGSRVKWRDIHIIAIDKTSPTKAFVAYGHNETFQEIDIFGRCQRTCVLGLLKLGEELPILRDTKITISEAKYKDLKSLCDVLAIPSTCHEFFENLPHGVCGDDDENACLRES